MTWILSETLAPPSTATKRPLRGVEGHAEVAQLLLHQEARPPRVCTWWETPSVEACARCAVPKASFTKTVAPVSVDQPARERGVVLLLLGWKRTFSRSSTPPSRERRRQLLHLGARRSRAPSHRRLQQLATGAPPPASG